MDFFPFFAPIWLSLSLLYFALQKKKTDKKTKHFVWLSARTLRNHRFFSCFIQFSSTHTAQLNSDCKRALNTYTMPFLFSLFFCHIFFYFCYFLCAILLLPRTLKFKSPHRLRNGLSTITLSFVPFFSVIVLSDGIPFYVPKTVARSTHAFEWWVLCSLSIQYTNKNGHLLSPPVVSALDSILLVRSFGIGRQYSILCVPKRQTIECVFC